jgi:hypothetical protein
MKTTLAAAGMMLSLFAALSAQPAGESGELLVVVTDPSGAVVSGARLELRNPQTGWERTGVTAENGEFRFLIVPSGVYDLRIEKEGFQRHVAHELRVIIGHITAYPARLEIGATTEVIEVSAVTAVVETERTHQANTLEYEFVQNLPIDRRDYLTFTLLAPGIVDSTALADNTDFRVAQTPNSGLSFYGSNGRGNSVTVDGGEANDAAGGVRTTLSQEAVEEFQINRSNYSAELGSASGGVINIVSRAGTNRVHGSAFVFLRDDSMDAGDPFARVLEAGRLRRVKPPADRQQLGGSIGGPLKRDRTFFFGAFEALNRDESSVVAVLTDPSIFEPTPEQEVILSRLPPPQAAALRAALTSPQATRELFAANSGVFPFVTDDYKFSVRLDHTAGPSDQMLFRYNFASVDESNASLRALVGASRGTRVRIFDSNVLGGWTRTFRPTLINDLRIQWNYYDHLTESQDRFGPEINIAGFGFFNRDIFLPSETITRRLEIKENLSWFTRGHSFKTGAHINVRGNHTDSATFFGGRFNFGPLPGGLVSPALASTTINGLQAFNLGLPQAYQQGFGDPIVSAIHPYYGFFVQDSWKVRPNLTLDFGLRYELDTRKKPLRTDKNNFAPRFAFAWDPFGDSKTSVRGGYGIFYSPIYFQIDYVVNALNVIDGRRPISQVLTTIQTPGPAAAQNIWQTLRRQGVITLPAPTRSIVPEDLRQFGIEISHTGPIPPFTVLFEPSPDYANAYSQQATFGIERQIGRNLAAGATYMFARTLKITRARDKNLLPTAPVDPALGIRVWRPQDFADPLLFQFNVYESTARASYHGLVLELKKRFSGRFSLAANYTFSKAIDDVTDFNSDFQANDQTNLAAEKALSAFDQRHKVVVYGVIQAPWRFQFAPIFRANSARPFNLLVGSDLNQDRHSTTDRPPFAGRNTGIGPSFWTFDLRLAKRIGLGAEHRHVELTAEAFNLFNQLNFASVNNTVGVIPGPFNLKPRHDRSPSEPLGYTSAFDPRRLQLGVRVRF